MGCLKNVRGDKGALRPVSGVREGLSSSGVYSLKDIRDGKPNMTVAYTRWSRSLSLGRPEVSTRDVLWCQGSGSCFLVPPGMAAIPWLPHSSRWLLWLQASRPCYTADTVPVSEGLLNIHSSHPSQCLLIFYHQSNIRTRLKIL